MSQDLVKSLGFTPAMSLLTASEWPPRTAAYKGQLRRSPEVADVSTCASEQSFIKCFGVVCSGLTQFYGAT